MIPASLITAARRKYNAVDDTTFFTDDELYDYLYQGELQLALESLCIEDVKQSTSVTGTSQYTIPTNTVTVRRVTYDGVKLKPISFRQDDAITLNNADTTEVGTPLYYVVWEDKIELRPTPDDAKTIDWRVYKQPEVQNASSTFETPARYHMALSDYIVSEMYAKEQNQSMSEHYRVKFEQAKFKAKQTEKKKRRGDAFAVVKDEDELSITILGSV